MSSEEVCIQEKYSVHAAIADVINENNSFFISFVVQEATAPFRFGNWRVDVAHSCSWFIPAALLRMCFQSVLWSVTIANDIHSLSRPYNL